MPKRLFGHLAVMGLVVCSAVARGQGEAARSESPKAPAAAPGAMDEEAWRRKLAQAEQQLKGLTEAQAKVAGGEDVARLRKQVELQQQQIETLLKMTQLLADQVKKQPTSTEAIDDLEERVTTQEARQQQAAQRDRELAGAHDQLVESLDAQLRNGPSLPATLREKFLPTRTNESPLAIYGTVAEAAQIFSGLPSTFRNNTVMLRPYLLMNEKWLMAANIALQDGGVQIWRAQIERFVNDNLTIVAGRFYSPVGFYSERLRENWVIKTPDAPLMFNQVYPLQLSFDGVQFRGAARVGNTPFKLEYAGFMANGLSAQGSNLTPVIYSNLSNLTGGQGDVNNSKTYGGRFGVSLPKYGVIAGLSGFANGAYDTAHHDFNLWDVDVNWHRGNIDFRFEYANATQQTPANPIYRKGMYAQLAYRQFDSPNRILQRLEWVARYDHVQFNGIDLSKTGINFGGLGQNYSRQPLDRNRYTLGANYWFTPSLVLKVAFEMFDELGVPSLRDNGFLAQFAWGW